MNRAKAAVVGAAESTSMGVVPHMSQLQLHADAALNALRDAGLSATAIDGIATAGEDSVQLAHYLGIRPSWIDGTGVGGCSFMMHLRHAVAAIGQGLCKTVLITHGESGKSRLPPPPFPWPPPPTSLMGQFETPFGIIGAPTMFTIPVLRYLKTYAISLEKLAMVPVIQREWAARNPRAFFKDAISVDDVLGAKMVAYPFTLLMCCPQTDGGGALIVTAPERAQEFSTRPVYVVGTGEACESSLISQMEDFTSSRAFRDSGRLAFADAGITQSDVDHLMIYDAFAHLPLYGLEALGFCKPGEAADFISERHTAPGGKLPVNTNGGGLSYMHSGMYGMYALQESVRQMRGIAPAQVPGAKISVAHGVGGMFAASSTIIFSNEKS
ncbi:MULTISPECIES: thiolase [unclassified Beijerinckia]|uniref:thiolase C-terminal domain-containing protein n=1 Tax=unclassified Beijerinckia TaxID=2638183 RepID=UPI0008951665|nr:MULTISPECIES: thiolase [unclassified Beijerinckia]MDH7799176.1 acetyl-CoA acetyltransferase [Beijerinckia sp. GAS462]SED92886.1 Acetyl-CoA acetyltransferase [Beijerinckia sp. 28-YEA-48]